MTWAKWIEWNEGMRESEARRDEGCVINGERTPSSGQSSSHGDPAGRRGMIGAGCVGSAAQPRNSPLEPVKNFRLKNREDDVCHSAVQMPS